MGVYSWGFVHFHPNSLTLYYMSKMLQSADLVSINNDQAFEFAEVREKIVRLRSGLYTLIINLHKGL